MTYAAEDVAAQGVTAELYSFETPWEKWYLTNFNRDISWHPWNDGVNFVTYKNAAGLGRSTLPVVSVGGQSEVSVDLPIEHAVSQRLLPSVTAIRRYMLVTVIRIFPSSDSFQIYWQGYVTSVNVRGRLAGLRISNGIDDKLSVDLPGASISVTCNNVLFDSICRLSRATYQVNTTMTSISGSVLNVASVGSPPNPSWYVTGEVVHTATTERRVITSYSGTALTLDAPFPSDVWAQGNAVQLSPGCDHTISTCALTYGNRRNFAGNPYMPKSNPWVVTMPGAT